MASVPNYKEDNRIKIHRNKFRDPVKPSALDVFYI